MYMGVCMCVSVYVCVPMLCFILIWVAALEKLHSIEKNFDSCGECPNLIGPGEFPGGLAQTQDPCLGDCWGQPHMVIPMVKGSKTV